MPAHDWKEVVEMEWMYSRADVVKAFEKHGVKTPLWAAARLGDLQTMSIRLD